MTDNNYRTTCKLFDKQLTKTDPESSKNSADMFLITILSSLTSLKNIKLEIN